MTNPMTLQSDLLAPVLTLLDSAIYGAAELALVNAKEYQEAAERCNAIARVVNEARELLKGAELSAMARDGERYRHLRKNAYAGSILFSADTCLNCDEPENEWDAAIDATMANTQENER